VAEDNNLVNIASHLSADLQQFYKSTLVVNTPVARFLRLCEREWFPRGDCACYPIETFLRTPGAVIFANPKTFLLGFFESIVSPRRESSVPWCATEIELMLLSGVAARILATINRTAANNIPVGSRYLPLRLTSMPYLFLSNTEHIVAHLSFPVAYHDQEACIILIVATYNK
jgi:hypothetical protein